MSAEPSCGPVKTIDAGEPSLLNRGFIALMVLFLFASSAMAAFFHVQGYLQSLLVPPAWIGVIIGADSLASFVVQPFCAPYFHPRNAGRWMAVGLLVLSATLLSYGIVQSPGALLVIRIAQGAGFICFLAAMTAAAVAFIPASKSGRAFSILSLVRLVPYAIVPPLVAFYTERSVPFPGVVACFAVLIAASTPVLLLLKPVGYNDGGRAPAVGPVGMRGLARAVKDRTIMALLTVNLVVFTCYTTVFFYIAGFGKEAGIGRTDIFFTIATAAMVAVRFLGSIVFDRVDKYRLTAWCLGALSLFFPLLLFSKGWPFYSLAACFGLAWGVIMPLLNAMVFDASPPEYKGINMNLTLVVMQGGFFLGPLLGGLILAASGYFFLFAACCPLSILALLITIKTDRRSPR